MAPDAPAEDEGRLASTSQNRAAGRALRAARRAIRLPDDQSEKPTGQAAFAERLSEILGISLSSTAVSNWENGRRSVPSAVLVAAAMAAGQSIDALFGESGESAVVEWANALGFPARLGQLEADFRLTRAELQQQLEELRRELAAHQVASMDLESARPTDEGAPSEDASSRRQALG